MSASFSPAELLLGVALQLLFTWALAAWGAWVAVRRGNGRFWRFARRTPWISLALLTVGTIVGVVLLMRSFGAVSNVAASERSSQLAQSIAGAMKASAPFLVSGYGLLLFAVVSFVVGSLRAPATGASA